jgi:hypothetical protein
VFDFIRQETVLVRYLTGGNPALATQRRITRKIEATVRPSRTLRLNAEYDRIVVRNSIAALPPASLEVQAAFPDRFVRDPTGRLVQLDARPVSFARDVAEYIDWGVDFRDTFGGDGQANEHADSGPSLGTGWRVAFSAEHTWFLDNFRLARAGLAPIDLLEGGASGYGGGQPRHQVRAQASVYHRGIGAQFFATWQSRSVLNSGTIALPSTIEFAPYARFDLRAFANLGPLIPQAPIFKGARVTLEVSNLFDAKRRVTDASGATPLRYQPFLLEPVGRTVAVAVRKVF